MLVFLSHQKPCKSLPSSAIKVSSNNSSAFRDMGMTDSWEKVILLVSTNVPLKNNITCFLSQEKCQLCCYCLYKIKSSVEIGNVDFQIPFTFMKYVSAENLHKMGCIFSPQWASDHQLKVPILPSSAPTNLHGKWYFWKNGPKTKKNDKKKFPGAFLDIHKSVW